MLALGGCGVRTVPVEGKVLYRGKPLEFGSVMFQPEKGPTARGTIQPDGTFRLSTYREGDGAIPGAHQGQITCFEQQRPGFAPDPKHEPGLSKPLIPPKYNRFDTSGQQPLQRSPAQAKAGTEIVP